MKHFFCLFLWLAPVFVFSQQTTFTTTFQFKGIVEGYDHMCKTQVWVDGSLLGESGEAKESAGGFVTVEVPYGDHELRIINVAQYEGAWEEHTIKNLYSIDCLWEGPHTFKKKKENFYLLFDIDDMTKVSWKKMPKK